MRRTLSLLQALAGNTVIELLRNKLLYVLLVFTLLLILGSIALASLTVGQWSRVINDVGLAAVQLSSVLIAVLVGIGLVAGEVERRTAYVTLAKPVGRGTFIVGRYLGLATMLVAIVGLMGLAIQVVLVTSGLEVHRSSLFAIALIAVEACVLASVAVVFSSFTTPVLGTIYTLSLFVLGHLAGDLEQFASRMPDGLRQAFTVAAYVLPNLDLLDLKSQAANELPVSGTYMLAAAGYGLAYSVVALFVASRVFRGRDLK